MGDEVALGEAVEAEDLLGGGPAGGAFFGVEGELGDAAVAHGAAEFAFDERLYEQGEEVDEEEGFDAAFVLEQGRRDLEGAFEVSEALFDAGLALVGVEHVGRREGAVVAEEGVLRRVPDHAAWLGEGLSGGRVRAFGVCVGAA